MRKLIGFALLTLIAGCSNDIDTATSLGAQAQQQLAAGQISAARESITAAVKERDDLPALHLLKGRIELAGNRFGPAFDAYSAALALEATNPDALLGVAQLGLRTGHIDDSESAADRILALQPDQPDALLVKGLLALVRKRPAETIEFADRILAASPGNDGGAVLKARALYMQGDLQGALDFMRGLPPSATSSDILSRTRLELLREARNAPGMLTEFAVLRQLNPKDLDLRLDEANLRYKTGDTFRARSLLRTAVLDLRPDVAQTQQIAALWREYDREPLEPAALRALVTVPDEAVRVEVARHYLDTGRSAIARSLLADARTLEARALAARVAIAAGDVAGGAAAAERILVEDKTQCDALIARSKVRSIGRRWSEAVIAAQTAGAECRQNVSAHIALAYAYEGKHDSAGARRAFSDGIALNPQDPMLSDAFREWLEAKRQTRQAIAEVRRLSRRTPALMSVWASYRDVCVRAKDESCAAEARAGLTRATTMLGVDPPPGSLAVRGLIGRLPPQ